MRATGVSHHAIGDFICSKIAADVDPQEMRTKFKAADQENSGRVSVDIFQKIVGDLGFDLNDTQKDELRNQVPKNSKETRLYAKVILHEVLVC